jgi:ABC-type glutathione transport system ATPase component
MGKTVIIVTHDTRIIEKYCDRAMLINNGRVMKVGAPTEIVMDYLEANISDEDRRIRKAQEAEHKKLQEQSLKKAPELQKEDVLIKKTLNRNLKSCIYRIYNHKGEETFALESGKSFQVKLEVEFSEDVRDLAFGVMFRSGVGKDLFGLHSLYSRKPNSVKEIKKGQKFEVSFQAEMILTQGTYPIYIGIASNVKYPNYDLVYSDEPDASIQVFSNDVFWGLVNSDFTSTIKQLGS